jgi:hypothetical protein
MKPIAVLILAVSAALWAGVVAAADATPESSPESAPTAAQASPSQAFGSDTRAWLEMQRSNAQASSTSEALPGPVMQKIYQRYVDSFARPIPDKFEQFSAKTDSK